MTMIKIAVAGASGRMGRTLIEACHQSDDCRLSAAFDLPTSPAIGRDAGENLGIVTGVRISDDPATVLAGCDFLIDFTRPEGSLVHLALCEKAQTGMIIGTTGFDAAGRARIEAAAGSIPIVFAPNMSVGVNVTFKLLSLAARILQDGYDIEVIEAHHRNKVDAPSGTALGMGEVIARALGRDLDEVGVFARHGVTGVRDDKAIGFSTIRGGDIVGDHTVMFAGIGERVEITHKASSRMTYAQGSLRACRFLAGKASGLFDMQDVLGLRD
ncbi:MAG: 4-hydroxy-tetrahydrodipicolinate reductase [Burkholderiaceae bacterium]